MMNWLRRKILAWLFPAPIQVMTRGEQASALKAEMERVRLGRGDMYGRRDHCRDVRGCDDRYQAHQDVYGRRVPRHQG